jgi:hypothetical protein
MPHRGEDHGNRVAFIKGEFPISLIVLSTGDRFSTALNACIKEKAVGCADTAGGRFWARS